MSIENEMVRIARIVAADQDLVVHVRGVSAFARKGEVTIPNIEHYDWLSGENAYRMLHGLTDHECGHASYTDFVAFEAWNRNTKPNEVLRQIVNHLEDAYVERMMARRYVGCGTNISLMNEWFLNRADPSTGLTMFARVIGGNDVVAGYMLALGAISARSRTFADVAAISPAVAAMITATQREITLAQALNVPYATQQNIDIATAIYEILDLASRVPPPPAPPPPPPPPTDDDEADDEGEDDEADDEGEDGEGKKSRKSEDDEGADDEDGDAGDEDDEDGEADDAGDEDGEADDEGEDGKKSRKSGDEGGEGTEPVETDIPAIRMIDLERWTKPNISLCATEAIDSIIRNVFEQPSTVAPYTVFSNEFDIEVDFSDDAVEAVASDSARNAAVYGAIDGYGTRGDNVREATEVLVNAFDAGLRATVQELPIGGADEGTIDPDMLVGFSVGSVPADAIYEQPSPCDGFDTAVSILVDCSGSMGGNKIVIAKQTAKALHQALLLCQIPHEVLGFTTATASSKHSMVLHEAAVRQLDTKFRAYRAAMEDARARGTSTHLFARGSSTSPVHACFKSFRSDSPYGLARIAACENNLDGEAVVWAAKRLAARGEKRRVLFVLSDGAPAGSTDNAQGARYLAETVKRCIASGIEVYGIGMQSDLVSQFYPKFWVVNDMADLTQVALTGLSDVLLAGRVEQATVNLSSQ